ncbi:MAG: cytochrome c [Desulfacinum sp.]|nr:cytochrome c [Desulfacinum sp.]
MHKTKDRCFQHAKGCVGRIPSDVAQVGDTMISLTLKSWLSMPLLGLGVIQLVTVLELLGRPERRFDAQRLRRIHQTGGRIAFSWIIVISVLCLLILRASGGEMTPRGAVHSLTAVFLLVLLAVKICIARFYRKLFHLVVPLGLVAFVLLLTTLTLSAGVHLTASAGKATVAPADGQVTLGESLFAEKCAGCHYGDKEETKIGPGLGGLAERGILPSSQRPATVENIKAQLNTPYGAMPAFADLPEADKDALAAFLLRR